MYKKSDLVLLIGSFIFMFFTWIILFNLPKKEDIYFYIAGVNPTVQVLTIDKKEADLIRGVKVKFIKNNSGYSEINYDNKLYLVNKDNLSEDAIDVIKETTLYVRTPVTLYKEDSLSYIKKGEQVKVIGYDSYNHLGIVNKYLIDYNNETGYVYSKYLVNSSSLASLNYDEDGSYQIHLKRGNKFGGGSAANLDFYPRYKPTFEDNVMPSMVKSMYLNSGVLSKLDTYIAIAKESGINAFVVDIKDNTAPAYESPVMFKYSKTNYEHAINTFDEYKEAIQKLKDNGFYVIGRITVFKDSYYIADHPESAIKDTATNQPIKHNGSYWPSAYMRDVWLFNVELAKEAVLEMGFNEIQFDYVRFPDRLYNMELAGKIDYINPYHEEKAQAIQNFVTYATDELHSINTYISIDVFGESAHNYVTGYGQYWGAISNVVDVISPMPYPDHFNAYEYGFKEPVWTVPYQLLSYWATNFVIKRQEEIPTPAKVRSWIQTHDTYKTPNVIYDASKVDDEIRALCDSNLKDGYMTWSSTSSISKYSSIKSVFKRSC